MDFELQPWHAPALATLISLAGVCIAGLAFWVRRWPSVPSVIDISIYAEKDDDSESGVKKLFLSYAYTVGNRAYAGENISLPLLPDIRDDQLSANRYREGAEVTVYYCPWAPGISCLEPGSLGRSLTLAVALVGLAVWLLVETL
jgi:hypothetical protein